ncbi:diaminopimelate epimerase, partial [Thermococci archaeon]
MIIPFIKMHGCGNDFIVINEFETFILEKEKSKFSKRICTRHFSVGADGVIFVRRATNRKADVKMQYFNADGSEGPMCGNGIRVLVKFAVDKGLVPMKKQVDVETRVGLIHTYPKYSNNKVISIKVDMGKPKIKLSDIPAVGTEETMIQKKINVPSFGV